MSECCRHLSWWSSSPFAWFLYYLAYRVVTVVVVIVVGWLLRGWLRSKGWWR